MTSLASISLNILDITTLIIFLVTYLGLAVGHWFYLKVDRSGIALLGSIAMLACGCLTLAQAEAAVDMKSILLLFSLMVVAAQLHFSGFYGWVAKRILNPLLDRPAIFLAGLILLSGLLSAFLNNDVVVIAMAPVVTLSVLNRKMNPIPFLIALALSSNIGCALTIIGNAQNVLVGEMGGLGFGEYLLFAVVPVTLSLILCYVVVYFLGRKTFSLPVQAGPQDTLFQQDMPFDTWRTVKGVGMLAIIVVLFVSTDLPRYLVALTAAGLLLCSHRLPSKKVLSLVNWQLLVLFIGLFVVVGAFVQSGLSVDMLQVLSSYGVNINDPFQLTLISAGLSNCINNSATVMLLVKVVDLSNLMNCYALALSNAFAGNLIIVGSLANIIAVQCAESFQLKIGFREFFKYGAPTAIGSVLILLGWISIF